MKKFSELSKAEKRVAIAKDVIKQVNQKRTVRQRMAVYQAALKLYKKGKTEFMCLIIDDLIGSDEETENMKEYFPELWEQRPKNKEIGNGGYSWWDSTEEFRPLRISALTAAIKECRKKLKSKK